MSNVKNLLRLFVVMMLAFGLTVGAASAGADNSSGDGGNGGNGGNGGSADADGGRDTNVGVIDQDSEQEQENEARQDQDVRQDNDNDLTQDNALTATTGGSAGGDCVANQHDDGVYDDDDKAGDHTVTNGDDSAACAHGDSKVGDSKTSTNQANAGENTGTNTNAQGLDQTNGNLTNNQDAKLDQSADENIAAVGGEGGSGGNGGNSGALTDVGNTDLENVGNTTTTVRVIIDRLLVILNSIINIGDDDDTTADDTTADDTTADDTTADDTTADDTTADDTTADDTTNEGPTATEFCEGLGTGNLTAEETALALELGLITQLQLDNLNPAGERTVVVAACLVLGVEV